MFIAGISLPTYGQGEKADSVFVWRKAADSLHRKGNDDYNTDKPKARGFYNQSIHFRKKSLETYKDTYHLWRSYYNIGKTYLLESRIDQAKRYLDTALTIGVKVQEKKPVAIGKTYFDLAELYKTIGDYKRSEECNLQAITLFEQGKEWDLHVKSLNNLGILYVDINEPQKALNYLERATKVSELTPWQEAINHLSAGFAYDDLEEWENALTRYASAKKLFAEDVDTLMIVFALNNEAVAYRKLGKYKEAKTTLNYALALAQAYYLEDIHLDYAMPFHNLGDVYYKIGQLDSALVYYNLSLINLYPKLENGLVEVEKLPLTLSKIDLLTFLHSKAVVLLDLYKQKQEKSLLKKSLNIFQYCQELLEAMRNSHSSDHSILFWQAETRPIYENAIEAALLSQQADLAFQFAEYSKAALLLESLNDLNAKELANLPETLLEEEKSLQHKIITFETLLERAINNENEAKQKELQTELFQTKEQHREFIRKIEKKYPRYYQAKYDTRTGGIEEFNEHLLDKGTALLEFVVGESIISVFSLSSRGITSHQTPKTTELEKQFFGLLEHVSTKGNNHKQYYKAAYELYEKLLGKSISQLPKSVDKLIIIPDDFLAYLPFEVLLAEKVDFDNRNYKALPYLFKKYAISYGYSASILLKNNKDVETSGKLPSLLGVAPSFEGQSKTLLHSNLQSRRFVLF